MKYEFEREVVCIFLNYIGMEKSDPRYGELVESFAKSINERCGEPLYPKPRESLALSVLTPKTAALAFDRVYRLPILDDPVPEEIGFYCGTYPEIGFCSLLLFERIAAEVGIDLRKGEDQKARGKKQSSAELEAQRLRLLCSEFQRELQIAPTIFYHARNSCKKEFPTGKHQILTASVSNIAMVDEKSLDWEQIIEFRKDTETRKKYRRFVRWVDTELKEKTPEEMEDLIAIRLDDYQWALKKHGVKVSLGTLSCLLDPKFLGAVSATVAATAVVGGSVWAALAGASLVVGQAAVQFGITLIDGLDERRKNNYEIAYIYEIQKQLR